MHEVFDALQFRVLRDRLYQTLESAEPEADAGFDGRRRARSSPAQLAGCGSPRTPAGGERDGRGRARAPGAAAPAT